MSGVLYYLDKDGKKQDAELHEEILNNPEADRVIAVAAIARAIADGMSEEDAREVYWPKGQPYPEPKK